MKINNFQFIDKALFFPEEKRLVIADLHLGYENALSEQGVLLPRTQLKQTKEDLEKVFNEINEKQKSKGKIKEKLNEIVILGDLKHHFAGILKQEWKDVSEILEILKKKSRKIILIKGNHDTILEPIARQQGMLVKDYYIKNGICFLHGHKMFSECLKKDVKMIVLGHKHPAVVLRDKIKAESYKCFLVGKWKSKEIVIMPSFFPLVEGSDVFVEDTNLCLPLKLASFKVYVVADKIYEFGILKKAGRLLET